MTVALPSLPSANAVVGTLATALGDSKDWNAAAAVFAFWLLAPWAVSLLALVALGLVAPAVSCCRLAAAAALSAASKRRARGGTNRKAPVPLSAGAGILLGEQGSVFGGSGSGKVRDVLSRLYTPPTARAKRLLR